MTVFASRWDELQPLLRFACLQQLLLALLRYPAAVRLPVRQRASLCIYTASWRGERVVLGASGASGRVITVCAGTEECDMSASAGVVAFVVACCASALAVLRSGALAQLFSLLHPLLPWPAAGRS